MRQPGRGTWSRRAALAWGLQDGAEIEFLNCIPFGTVADRLVGRPGLIRSQELLVLPLAGDTSQERSSLSVAVREVEGPSIQRRLLRKQLSRATVDPGASGSHGLSWMPEVRAGICTIGVKHPNKERSGWS